jgi:hypothetical protein
MIRMIAMKKNTMAMSMMSSLFGFWFIVVLVIFNDVV